MGKVLFGSTTSDALALLRSEADVSSPVYQVGEANNSLLESIDNGVATALVKAAVQATETHIRKILQPLEV